MSMVSPALLVAPVAEGWLRSSREPAGVLLAGAPGLRLPWRDRYPSTAMAGGYATRAPGGSTGFRSGLGEGKIMSTVRPVLLVALAAGLAKARV